MKKQKLSKQKLSKIISKPFFISTTFFLITTTAMMLLFVPVFDSIKEGNRNKILRNARYKVAKISYELHSRINLNQAVASFVEHDVNVEQKKFSDFVHSIIQNDDGGVISSMSFAEDFTITRIAPYDFNKKALGLDLSLKPGRKENLEKSAELGKAYVEGPFVLEQGNVGIVSYIPVFITDSVTQEKRRIGFTDVVILWERFLKVTDLEDGDEFIDYAIRGKNATGAEGPIFYGDPDIFERSDVLRFPIMLPFGQWELAAYPKDGWNTGLFPSSFEFSLVISLIFSIVVYFALRIARSQIQETERRYRYITEKSNDMIWTMDFKTLYFTYISESCVRHSGYTPEEYYGMTVRDVLTPESTEKFIRGLNNAIKSLKSEASKSVGASFELQQYNKWNILIWIEVSAVISRDEDGNFFEIIGVTRTINDRKKLELEMLEQQKELKKANATKNKFFSIMAHDLKNPIASLLRICEFLIEDYRTKNEAAVEESIVMLHEASTRTYKLLENLLAWARSQMGSLAYTPIEIPLTKLVNDCVDYMQVQAVAKNINLQLNNPLGECLVVCDYNMMHTVLRNLVSNALKFSFPGSTVEVSADEYNDDLNYVQVAVKDTGLGIDPNDMDKLFRIDEKITSSTGTNDESGTGLGLILCKEFIDKHNCKIWVESEKGKGTTFFFTILKQHLHV